MAYNKQSMIVVIDYAEDGIVSNYYAYITSPPPPIVDTGILKVLENSDTQIRQRRVSDDKEALKTELNAVVDALDALA